MTPDTVSITGLEIPCVIGVLSEERGRVQPLVVDLELSRDLRTAGRTGRIRDTSDYARIARQIEALVQFRRYRLLEVAASEITAMLFGLEPALERVRIRLEKPAALQGLARAAGVRMDRTREDYPQGHEPAKFGEVDILVENREAGVYLLHIDPGKAIPHHHHQVMRELEWLVRGEVVDGAKPVEIGVPRAWKQGEVHGYRNVGDRTATLLCVDTPPFQPDDEIEVPPP